MGDEPKRAPDGSYLPRLPALDAVALRIEKLSRAVAEQTERMLDEERLGGRDLTQILEAARRSSELARELVALAHRERDLARSATLGAPAVTSAFDAAIESSPVRSHRRVRSAREREPCVVLLVDDEPLLLKTLSRMFEPYPHRVLTASSGAEAIALVGREASIDLLVTDLVLPGMTGSELAQRLRVDRPELRVLYTSGWDPASSGVRLAEDGSEAFLSKPFTATELDARLTELMAAENRALARGG